jgi:DNA repair protein RecN (Recombination protein N)
MLTTLRIKNLALVADLTLELPAGYNVITGETGAGKSILIGALNLVLGERADRASIRAGANACSVEAVFDIRSLRAPLAPFLEENGLEPCEDHQLVLKRAFTTAGANRQFINGSPTSLNTLTTLGEWLVDIHGPHEHQSLLHPARQLAILDAFGNLLPGRNAFTDAVHRLTSLETEKAALVIDDDTHARELDLLRFQAREISDARLQPGEDSRLETDYQRASHAARLLELTQAARQLLSDDESSVITQAGALGRTLHEIARIDPAAARFLPLHQQAVESLNEVLGELSHYADHIDIDPERLQGLEERLNLIQSLKRKYGGTLESILARAEHVETKLRRLEGRDAELARIQTVLDRTQADLVRLGHTLTTSRRKTIPSLCKAVSRELKDLGFAQSRFDISLETTPDGSQHPPSPSGFDTIDFQFSPNVGEPLRPLRAIASSGEMARVMLALKTVLADEDEIPVLVFDEVDANVGGETAVAVGDKMLKIARNRQVLCITHLPAVAATAVSHYVVTKQVRDGRTLSEIHPLTRGDRVTELARMLGGQSAAARKHAEAMLQARH